MAGTQKGGIKASATNKTRYGLDFYRQIGRKGGKLSRGGIFAMDRDFASRMGKIGGTVGRRKKKAVA